MKNKITFIFFIFQILFTFPNLFGQTTIFYEPFEDGNINAWISSNSDPNSNINWTFDADGKAEGSINWNNRPAIISPSDEGIDTDALGTAALEIDTDIPQQITLTSTFIDCSIEPDVFLRFNQYYAVQQTPTISYVEVSNDDGQNWTLFPIRDNGMLEGGEETTAFNVQEFDISLVAAGFANVQIRFTLDGTARFWLLDDIRLFSNRPETSPISYFGDSLEVFGKPYDVEGTGWPYVPYQIVVEFDETATALEKQNIRDTFGFALIDTCVCNKLELWALDGQGDLSEPFPINERIMGVSSKSKVNGADYNKFNFNELQNTVFSPANPLLSVPSGITSTPTDAVLIAVLDTGVDFGPQAPLTPLIWRSESDLTLDGMDQDSTCYNDDFVGWNFVHKNNNPSDDHSHGTHVAGIIAMNFPDTSGCKFRILPVKTHDEDGVSNLFQVTCGTYYAIKVGANVINDSWGAYGTGSIILANAIQEADIENVLIVTSAGNDALELGSGNFQYPACFSADNIITVGSFGVNPEGELISSTFSNYDSLLVDILAPGENVHSYVPGGGLVTQAKSGTSQATPAVSAAAAFVYCNIGANTTVRNCVLDCAIQHPTELGDYATAGRVLNLDPTCLSGWTATSVERKPNSNTFDLYPNPVAEKLNIISKSNLKNISLQVTDISGRIMYGKERDYVDVGENIEINVEHFPSGMYFIFVNFEGLFWTEKFLKH
jgi:hypothetical protein